MDICGAGFSYLYRDDKRNCREAAKLLKKIKPSFFYTTELVFCVVCAVLVFWKIIQWPGVGSWWLLVYFFIFPAFIDRAFHLFYFLWQKKVLEGTWKKSLVVILSIVLGVILTGLINQKASSWAMERFRTIINHWLNTFKMIHIRIRIIFAKVWKHLSASNTCKGEKVRKIFISKGKILF